MEQTLDVKTFETPTDCLMGLQLSSVFNGDESQGEAQVETFQMTKEDIRWAMFRAEPISYVHYLKPKYTYTKLVLSGTTVMSDTPMERITNRDFVNKATGHVLVAGLGLGLTLFPLFMKDEVKSVTVVENSTDVIATVFPALRKHPLIDQDRLKIVVGDIFEPDKLDIEGKYETIYFDIWPSISADNYEDMKKLHKLYRKYYNMRSPDRWIGSWLRDYVKREHFGGY